ncbi:PRC-barrel domain-containing protein [Tepidimicrobium xylanilyticum]|uniref:Uncharacterized protein YrrD, contains PRC-barrel domain n=1 Tax=Tepidimicrobium xylanilyticum TaxID=1123352 RepID=A0A1H2SL28_9FIRM|nr:PRC-barrel domain-containing protein [Tepidimicrobium xylanilyticum]GMG96197.1 hypothetical protein EN5CB1_10230 [Tepidimicrobium xylanilyticum]SDW31759.1 Uncharacterized protein YrrD, contains PRC-barrel domain [Tepidimicrobium xylanilyticum]
MIRYKQLITLDLIDENNIIGKIEDVVYSEDYRKIKYLVVKNGKLIKNKFLIPYNEIEIKNNNQALLLGDINGYANQMNIDDKDSKLINKVIKDENGEYIGYIKDIVINKKDGTIDGFIITEGLIEDLIKGRNYIPLLKNIQISENGIYLPHETLI